MKNFAVTFFCLLVMSLSAQADPRVLLSEDQAKAIAVIQVRALNAKDDVLSVVRNGFEPEYVIASVEHLVGYDVYQISVRRMQPGQTCQQSIVINNASGELDAKQVPTCE
jgi:hypothetical protein